MSVSFGKLETILEEVPPHPEHLISALHKVQAEFDHIPAEALDAVCDHVGVARSQGWAVATFYRAFNLEPKKEHEVCVCMGTACHVRGSANVYDKFSRSLATQATEGITKDTEFSVKKVYCLGCCSMGPVATVNEEIHSHLDQKKAGDLIETYSKRVRP